MHTLLDGPCDVTRLPAHNGDVLYPGMMTCGVGMVINGGMSPEMFIKPFLNSPCRHPYVLLITPQPVTPLPVYYSTFLCDVALVLWGYQEVSDGITSLDMDLDSQFTTNELKPLIKSLFVGY